MGTREVQRARPAGQAPRALPRGSAVVMPHGNAVVMPRGNAVVMPRGKAR
jgi:hypothetical protein